MPERRRDPAGAAGHGRRVELTATGHPHLRATHHKTLELTAASAVGAAATCVVGVGARIDPAALGLLRGEVRIELRVGDRAAAGVAVINPDHQVSDRLVIRRSDHRDPDTLAVDSTLTAADLDPAMTAALAGSSAEVTLVLTEVGPPPPLVIISPAGATAPQGRLGLLWTAADQRIDLARPAEPCRRGIVAATVPDLGSALPPQAASWLDTARGAGARIAVPATADSTGAGAALLAAGRSPAPALWLGRWPGGVPAKEPLLAAALRGTTVPAAVTAPAAALVRPLREATPTTRLAVPDRRLDLGLAMRWLPCGEAAADLAGRGTAEVTVVIGPAADAGMSLDPDATVRALMAAGVPARTVADALRPLGISRRWIYDRLTDPGDADADSPG